MVSGSGFKERPQFTCIAQLLDVPDGIDKATGAAFSQNWRRQVEALRIHVGALERVQRGEHPISVIASRSHHEDTHG